MIEIQQPKLCTTLNKHYWGTKMTLVQHDFIKRFSLHFSDVNAILDAYIAKNGELLCYDFMSNIYRFLTTDPLSRCDIVSYLSKNLDPDVDDDIGNLIAIGFVECIPSKIELDAILRDCPDCCNSIRRQWLKFQDIYL